MARKKGLKIGRWYLTSNYLKIRIKKNDHEINVIRCNWKAKKKRDSFGWSIEVLRNSRLQRRL